jgi:hypothetical protein
MAFSEESSSSKSVLFQGVECGLVKIPLHHVNLTSDLVSGPMTVGVRSILPVDGVHLLLYSNQIECDLFSYNNHK